MEILEKVNNFVNDMNETNQSLEKIKILKKYSTDDETFCHFLQYVYHPDYIYHVSSKHVMNFFQEKYTNESEPCTIDIFVLLDNLKNGIWTGNIALTKICDFIMKHISYQELIYKILDKNLKIRISQKIVSKYLPNFFPSFPVSLANNYKESLLVKHPKWYISRKLDGIRCLVFIYPEKKSIKIMTRNEKEIKTLGMLEKEIFEKMSIFPENVILDGEITSSTTEKDDFQFVMKHITKKNHCMENFVFNIFDMIPENEFRVENKDGLFFHDRYQNCVHMIQDQFEYIKVLDQIVYTPEKWKEMKRISSEKGWEGLILRADCPYVGKRSNTLLKYKEFHDEEFIVKEINIGPFRVIDEISKKEKTIDCLSSVLIEYGSGTVQVGSGFSIAERKFYHENPHEIIQKKITVKYFEKTEKSLRFPIFKCVRGN